MFWFLKKIYEYRKRHCSNGFCRISKFIEIKGVAYISKSRWDAQYLEYLYSHMNVSSKQVLSKWMHFKHVLTSWGLQ